MNNTKNKKTNRVLISAGIAALSTISVLAFSANLSHTVYADTNTALTNAQLEEQKDNSKTNVAPTKAEQIVDQTQAKQEATNAATENKEDVTENTSTDTTAAKTEAKTAVKQNANTQLKATKFSAKATAKDQAVIGKGTGDTNKGLANTTANNLKNNNYNFDQVIVGTAEDDDINKALGDQSAQDLKDNGFVIKNETVSGKNNLYVQGKDDTGLFYALNEVNTLANRKAKATEFNERQEPQMSVRGVIEGFYGQPWSNQARKDLFKFMGEHRMNVYIYSPKDDTYLRKNWKELYPQEQLDQIKDLVDEANRDHVTFVYTLSPGNSITYSSKDDYEATVKKFDQLRQIGVKQFYIALDDIPTSLNATDRAKFPNKSTKGYPNNQWSGLADAQAYYLNKVETDYIQKNNLPDLWLVPTNYAGSAPDPFKEAQGEVLNPNIHMQWTGEGVFSGTITSDSINRAKNTYNTKHLFIWDNFPVNDSDQMRLYLNPVVGRAGDLYKATDGFTANPMIQPYASWFALGSYADYMWNAQKYDPKASIEKVIQDIAGNDPEKAKALGEFVDLNQYWNYAQKKDQVHAPQLTALFNSYEKASYGSNAYTSAYQALKTRLQDIIEMPTSLYGLKVQGFYNDAQPWIQAASHWAKAALAALQIQDTVKSGKPDLSLVKAANQTITSETKAASFRSLPDSRTSTPNQITPTVGDGEFQNQIAAAYQALDQYLQLKANSAEVKGHLTSNLKTNGQQTVDLATDGDPVTYYQTCENPKPGTHFVLTLDRAADIQRIIFQQGVGDNITKIEAVLTKADVLVGMTNDVTKATKVGEITAKGRVEIDLSKPVKGRYVFFEPTEDTGNWLRIREITVYSGTSMQRDNIADTGSSTLSNALDGQTETVYQGKLQDATKPGVISETFVTPLTDIHSVAVMGDAKGTVAVYDGKEWHDIGKTDGTQVITELPVGLKEVDGLRFTLDPNQGPFSINDINLSTKDINASQPTTPTNPTGPVSPVNPVSPTAPSSTTTTGSNTNTGTGTTVTAPHAGSTVTSREANYIYVLVRRNAGIYNKDGKKHIRKLIRRGTQLRVYRKVKTAKGKRFYVITKGKYKNKMILTSKVKGIIRTLKHNAYVYKANGKLTKRLGKSLLKKKGSKVVTYGKIRTIHGKKMYQIGRNQFVKVANF